jgi:hypothetical protein
MDDYQQHVIIKLEQQGRYAEANDIRRLRAVEKGRRNAIDASDPTIPFGCSCLIHCSCRTPQFVEEELPLELFGAPAEDSYVENMTIADDPFYSAINKPIPYNKRPCKGTYTYLNGVKFYVK